MAASDSSPVVRLYLAAALQRIPESNAWKVAQGLLSHAGDADDNNLPKMIWFGIEGNVENSTKVALDQALQSEIPMVSNFIARRAVAANELAAVVAAIGRARNSGQRIPLLEGLRDGLAGQRYLEAPKGWAAVEEKLIRSQDSKERSLALRLGNCWECRSRQGPIGPIEGPEYRAGREKGHTVEFLPGDLCSSFRHYTIS